MSASWLRRLVLLVLAAVACATLTGCEKARDHILVWHVYRGEEQRAFQELATAYEAAHGRKVTLLALPYDAYLSKLDAAIPRGNGPDLFIGPHERLGAHRRTKTVVPVGDAFGDDDARAHDDQAVAAVTDEGVRWAIPLAHKCAALYLSDALRDEPPPTLDALLARKERLPAGSYPLAYEATSPYFHAALLHGFGGSLFKGGTYAMVGPEASAAATYLREATRGGRLPEEASGALVKQLFLSGRADAVISGPWLAAELGATPFRIVPLPKVKAGSASPMRPYLTVESAFLTPEGAARAEVREFARWLGGRESALVRARVARQIVTRRDAWDDAELRRDPVLSAFHDAARDAEPMPTSTAMHAMWVPALQALKKIAEGDAPIDGALDEARARYEDAMRPPPPSPSPAPLAMVMGLIVLAGAALAVKRARQPGFRAELTRSVPAYRYVAHAVVIVTVLVVLPLAAGALTSFFAGTRDEPRYVGLGNYIDILTARGGPLLGHGSFYLTLLVTVLWTVCNVTLHVGFGLLLGIVLSRPLMRLRAVYRVLLVLPWAVPSYVTALAWKGMFHKQFGAVNAILSALGAEPRSWFSSFSTAFVANLATNVWLGFPFMMVVVLGALTSIPKEVLEAAEVDGATRWQRFRLVTLPLLLPALLPSILLGAVWTFNMFNVVFLVSGGEPDGTTDILVSEAYRWAFTRNAQYGYAAAYAVLIFGLLALMSRWTSGKLERAS